MLEVLGVPKVMKQLLMFAQFRKRVNAKLEQQKGNYISMARRIVREVVYAAPENPLYPRSGNTEAAVNAKVIRGNRINSQINVFLDPKKAANTFGYKYFPYQGQDVNPKGIFSYYYLTNQGGRAYYPSYVRRGIFFKKRGDDRDFKSVWAVDIGKKFRRDVARSVR